MNRRRVLALLSTASLPTIAGCGNLFGPDPEPLTNETDGEGGGSGGAVRITEVEGIDTDGNGTIETLRVHVILQRGSGAVDLSEATYTLQRSTQTATRELEQQQNAYLEGGGNGVTFETVEGGDGDATVLQSREDEIAVQFDLTAIDEIDPLGPGEGMTFTLETAQETTASRQLEAPDEIEPDEPHLIQ